MELKNCERFWKREIKMKSASEIERLAKKIRFSPNAAADERILTSAEAALEKSIKTKSAALQPTIWRIIMKSRITKIAAAAVIIIAVLIGINQFGGSIDIATPAYAIEQTIQASHSIRYLHIRNFKADKTEPKEFWVQCDEFGQIKNARIHMPEWDSPSDGAKVIVWEENKAQVWVKKKNILATIKDKAVAEHMLKMLEECNPRLAVERLNEQEEDGKIMIEIDEPSNKAEPIVVTATYLSESSTPGKRTVLFIDQATKLVKSIEFYKLRNRKYEYLGLLEFYDYNQPIQPKMFTLDNIPADAMKINQTTQEVGLVQGKLSDEEISVKVVRQFLEALISKDYVTASKLYQGIPVEFIEKQLGKKNFIRVVSIGKPTPSDRNNSLRVPCKYEIELDGEKSVVQSHPYVRPVFGQPGRWTIDGGI